jgi:putative nucleotidyltransferase with HDIG domain
MVSANLRERVTTQILRDKVSCNYNINDIKINKAILSKLKSFGLISVLGTHINTYDNIPIIAESRIRGMRTDLEICNQLDAVPPVYEIVNRSDVRMSLLYQKEFSESLYTHSLRTALYATALGQSLELPDYDLYDLVVATLLHDLGKEFVPRRILNKPEPLTRSEYEVVQTHPLLGCLMAMHCSTNKMIINAIAQHQERSNGSGYPLNLEDKDITIYAKIIGIVDSYDAIRSLRPYKDVKPITEVCAILRRESYLYDTELLELFLDLLQDTCVE